MTVSVPDSGTGVQFEMYGKLDPKTQYFATGLSMDVRWETTRSQKY